MRVRPVLAGLLLLSLPLAGCFGDDPLPAERKVRATGGRVSDGWAYDGVGVVDGGATLEGALNDPANTGLVTVTFLLGGRRYEAVFDAFSESKPFMDGGIRFETPEHGDSGVGDASIPLLHAHVAAWGAAKVTREGEPLVGANGDAWGAHLMVSRDTVRAADGTITNAAGTAPYDPAKPTDARRVENDPQALFFLKHPDGETFKRVPLAASSSASIQGVNQVATADVPAESGVASALVNVTVRAMPPAPVAAGQVTLRILDAEGNELAADPPANVLPNQPYTRSFELDPAKVTGPLKVEIRGNGAYSMLVDYAITYDDHPFLVVTWDDVTLE